MPKDIESENLEKRTMTRRNMKTIEIDFDVFQIITLERKNFDESENDALRRLLGIEKPYVGVGADPEQIDSGCPWFGKGVELPAKTEVRMEYLGNQYRGTIRDGLWEVGGNSYKSPSAAASGVARTKDGRKTSLNGWTLWHVKRPHDNKWTALNKIRK